MPLLLISLLALLSIGQAGAERLQIDDPLQVVRAPAGDILFQDKRGFWEADSQDTDDGSAVSAYNNFKLSVREFVGLAHGLSAFKPAMIAAAATLA
jgi:hypothetical protein